MRDFLRFMFSPLDRDRIAPGSLTVEDVTTLSNDPEEPRVQSLKITGRVSDTLQGPLHVLPLFPGVLKFLALSTAGGSIPNASGVDLTNGYAGWKTEGILKVKLEKPQDYQDTADHCAGLEVIPTVAWYHPIVLSEGFIFNTLASTSGLKVYKFKPTGSNTLITQSSVDWKERVIAGFLQGRYVTKLTLKDIADNDDVVTQEMPTIVMATDGTFTLYVTMATDSDPTDGESSLFNDISGTVGDDYALHARYGEIPARHVYRMARSKMIGADPGTNADDILADWPTTRRYHPVQFTRTWLKTLSSGEAVKNYSVHFPKQIVSFRNAADSSVRLERDLPPHGMVYLPVEPGETGPSAPQVEFAAAGDMKWLNGATPNAWREKADTTVLSFNLETDDPHVIMRRQMREAMFDEEILATSRDGRCTYISLRRTVRALVDNRIAGGRLNYDPTHTSIPTNSIIAEAVDETGVAPVNRHHADADHLSSALPLINHPIGDIAAVYDQLGNFLHAFFPEIPTEISDAGRSEGRGRVGYYIWISKLGIFVNPATLTNGHFGRGGAGALVYLGLADAYAFDSDRQTAPAVETDNQYYHRLATAMRTGLVPGAAFQFWDESSQFELVKAGSHPCPTPPGEPERGCGHSPLFHEYDTSGSDIKVKIYDQMGKSTLSFTGPSTNRRLPWWGHGAQIWCAANWNE